MTETGTPFTHSTPELYDRYMGPLLFEQSIIVYITYVLIGREPRATLEALAKDMAAGL